MLQTFFADNQSSVPFSLFRSPSDTQITITAKLKDKILLTEPFIVVHFPFHVPMQALPSVALLVLLSCFRLLLASCVLTSMPGIWKDLCRFRDLLLSSSFLNIGLTLNEKQQLFFFFFLLTNTCFEKSLWDSNFKLQETQGSAALDFYMFFLCFRCCCLCWLAKLINTETSASARSQ